VLTDPKEKPFPKKTEKGMKYILILSDLFLGRIYG
jgi:hypothetical protein